MDKIESIPIRELVLKQLREKILNYELKPGDKIVEANIAKQLNVSRTPVREALHSLEVEGLIEIYPRKYCLVKGISLDSIDEINLIRSKLEPLTAREASKNLTDDQIDALGATLRKAEEHYLKNDLNNLVKTHDQFHNTIINASKLPRIIKLLENLHEYIAFFRLSFMSKNELVERSIKEHNEIYEAIKERNEEKVERIYQRHLEGILEYEQIVIEDLRKELVFKSNGGG